jgi:hypothetical protein
MADTTTLEASISSAMNFLVVWITATIAQQGACCLCLLMVTFPGLMGETSAHFAKLIGIETISPT